MKKLKIVSIALVAMALVACGNKDWVDTVYTYEKAIIELPDGSIVEGEVDSWTDYADADQLQIEIDGVIYLVHASKATLIQE